MPTPLLFPIKNENNTGVPDYNPGLQGNIFMCHLHVEPSESSTAADVIKEHLVQHLHCNITAKS
jgi:hypothetical protein